MVCVGLLEVGGVVAVFGSYGHHRTLRLKESVWKEAKRSAGSGRHAFQRQDNSAEAQPTPRDHYHKPTKRERSGGGHRANNPLSFELAVQLSMTITLFLLSVGAVWITPSSTGKGKTITNDYSDLSTWASTCDASDYAWAPPLREFYCAPLKRCINCFEQAYPTVD